MICVKTTPVRPFGTLSSDLPLRTVEVPRSKYMANRLLVIATLAKEESHLFEVPKNDDVSATVGDLLCASEWIDGDLNLQDSDDDMPKYFPVYTEDNGTLSRIMAPLLLLIAPLFEEGCLLYGSEQMNARPMKDLFIAMEQLGGQIEYLEKDGHLPVMIKGKYRGGECFLPGDVSSQYFTALLLSAPYAENDVIVHAKSPLISSSYVDMTIQCMREAGVEVQVTSSNGLPSFHVIGGRKKVYQGFNKTIETDPSAASYFMAMAALNFMRLKISNFPRDSVQGEVNFYKVLEKIGCQIHFEEAGDGCTLTIDPPKDKSQCPPKLEVNVRDMSDVGPTILVMAVALGHLYGVETHIDGVAHLRYKESNRVEGMSGELSKIGAKIDVGQDSIRVFPATLDSAVVRQNPLDSLGDHRLAMSFSLLSLITGCVFIKNEKSVNKTFPHFFELIETLGFECVRQGDTPNG